MAHVDQAISRWIREMQESMEAGLREVMLSPGMLLLGVVFLMQWYALPFFPDVSELVGDGRFVGIYYLRDIGTCIIVFQLYFVPQLRAMTLGSPFVASCLVILYTNYILFFIKERLLTYVYGQEYKDHERKRQNLVTNDYIDISSDWSKVSMVFLVQLNLSLYYVRALNEAMSKWEEYYPNAKFSSWGLGVLVIVVAADETGAPFRWKHWRRILALFAKAERSSAVGSSSRVVFRLVLFSRILCDFIINSLSRSIMIATAPLLLSMSDEFEFILDVTAIAFIAKLDDLEPPKSVDDVFMAFVEQHNMVLPADEQHYHTVDGASRSLHAGQERRAAGYDDDDLDLWSLICGVISTEDEARQF